MPSIYLIEVLSKRIALIAKIRPVFDASISGEDPPSLNHCLETDPNLIEQIPRILIRFRWRKIGIIADIRERFLANKRFT